MKKWRTQLTEAPVRKRRRLAESVFLPPPARFGKNVVLHGWGFSSFTDGVPLFAGKRRRDAARVLWPSTFLNPGELVDRCFYGTREWHGASAADSTTWTDEGDC